MPRKQIRLPPACYEKPGSTCLLTLCTFERVPVFRRTPLTEICVAILNDESRRCRVVVYAYCFMPDHLHILGQLTEGGSWITYVHGFKGRSTRAYWRAGGAGKLWQRSFNDRFLRRDDDVRQAASYVLNNPVRARLVAE